MVEQAGNDVNPWAEIVGPCYTTESFARVLGWSKTEVTEAAKRHDVLQLTTSDGVDLYPAFQLWERKPVPGLADVLRVLRGGVDSPWTWAQWLNTPVPTGECGVQLRSIEQLRAGRLDEALRDAQHDAASWSS